MRARGGNGTYVFVELKCLQDTGVAFGYKAHCSQQLKDKHVRAESFCSNSLLTTVEWINVSQAQTDLANTVLMRHDAVESDLVQA
jgi:hypothetical protein